MTLMHLLIIQAELISRSFLDVVIPAICELDTTNIQE